MSELDLLIKGGTIVTASDHYLADVGIKDGKIVLIGREIALSTHETVDATGHYVFPGGIDVHTHLDMPFGGTMASDDFATGTVAGAYGGTTTIVDFAIQAKGQTLAQTAETWQKKAVGKSVIDYGLHIAITDMNDDILAEIPNMIADGYPSYKLFMTYDGLRVTDEVLMKVLVQTKLHGGLVSVHAENNYMIDYMVKKYLAEGKTEPLYHALSRPAIAEGEATGRAIRLATLVQAPLYIVHLSCKESLAEVAAARDQGLPIMAETCPQYLYLSEDNYREPGFNGAKYVMSPPLRTVDNQEFLWKGLQTGYVQIVATDHCPFFFKGQKDMGRDSFVKIPNGAPGIETRMILLFGQGVMNKKLSLEQFVNITATNPAKIFGMYPNKGTIALGSDADLVIFDPLVNVTITKSLLHENVDYTPYEGIEVQGVPVMTISGGKIIVKNGQFVGQMGAGKFIKRTTPIII